MWRSWILCVACGGGTAAPIAQPAAPPIPIAEPDPMRVPANQMLARVSYQSTNTWIDIAIDGTGSNARGWCSEIVKRFEQRRVDPLKLVVERDCEPTQLPPPQRRGFTISLAEPIDVLEVAMIGAGSAPEPPTGTITHVSRFETLAACERDRERVVEERTKSLEGAAESKRQFVDGQLEIALQRAKQTCDEVAALKKAKPCRATDTGCLEDHRFADRKCVLERDLVAALKQQSIEQEPPLAAPACVALP